MKLFKLKTGQLLNLDHVVRINPQIDPTTKKNYFDLEFGGLNVSIRDEDDIAAFRVIAERNTPPRS